MKTLSTHLDFGYIKVGLFWQHWFNFEKSDSRLEVFLLFGVNGVEKCFNGVNRGKNGDVASALETACFSRQKWQMYNIWIKN